MTVRGNQGPGTDWERRSSGVWTPERPRLAPPCLLPRLEPVRMPVLGRGRAAAVLGARAWLPTDLPGLVLWLAADKITGLSDGDPVTTWADASGQGNNATQATAAKKPTWIANGLNGKAVVRFDGVDDWLSVASISLNAYHSLFVVGKFTNAAPLFIEHSPTTNTNPGYWIYGTSDHPHKVRRDGEEHYINAAVNWMGSTFASVTSLYDGAFQLFKNGAGVTQSGEAGTARNNTAVSDTLYIGSRAGTSLFSNGDFAEIILYDSVALAAADRQRVESYLNAKYQVY